PKLVFLGEIDSVDQVVLTRVNGVQELGDLLRRVLQVIIQSDNVFPPRMAEAAHEGIVLTVVAHQLNNDDAIIVFRLQLTEYVPRPSSAAVLDEDDFMTEPGPLQYVQQPRDQSAQRRFRAVDRDDYRDVNTKHRSSLSPNNRPHGTPGLTRVTSHN